MKMYEIKKKINITGTLKKDLQSNRSLKNSETNDEIVPDSNSPSL